jgi:hypothetical protein
VSEDQVRVIENSRFEFEAETLGRIYCRPFDLKLLFRFIDLIKLAPDTVRDCVCSLLSVVGERLNDAVPEERGISMEQAKALSDLEIEQFAARFLEAANWIGPLGKAKVTPGGSAELPYGERLKCVLETYEKRLAEETKFYSPPDVFSGVVPDHGERRLRSIVDAKSPASLGSVAVSGSWNSDLEQRHRLVRGDRTEVNGLLEKGMENTGTFQRIREVFESLKAHKQDILNRHIRVGNLQKIRTIYQKLLRSKLYEWETKSVYIRFLAGVLVISLFILMVLDLIVLRTWHRQELAAIVSLTSNVDRLSERTDAQTKILVELIKQHDSERENSVRGTPQFDAKLKKNERQQLQHSSLGVQRRKAVDTHCSRALKANHE